MRAKVKVVESSVPILNDQKMKAGLLSMAVAQTWNPGKVFSTYQLAVAVGACWGHTVGSNEEVPAFHEYMWMNQR